MKTMRNILFIGTTFLALAACSKSEIQPSIPQEGILEEPEEVLYSYELPISDNEDTRTLFSSDKTRLIWESGDALGVYAKVGGNTSVNKSSPVNTSVTPRKVTVKSSVAITVGSTLYAYYPFSSSNNSAPYTAVTLNIPHEQSQGASGLDTDAMPMVAIPYVTTEALGTSGDAPLRMVGLGSVVCFKIFNSAGSDDNIEKVDLITTSGIAGDFTYDLTNPVFDGETVTVAEPTGFMEQRIRTTLATPLSLSGATEKATAKEVYMIAAPGTYSGEINIYLTDKDGNNRKVCKRSFSGLTLTRNHSRNVSFNINGGTTITNGIWNATDLFAAIKTSNDGGDCSQYMVDSEFAVMDDIDMTGIIRSYRFFSPLKNNFNGNHHRLKNWTTQIPLCNNSNAGTVLKDLIIDNSCTYIINTDSKSAWLVGGNSGTVTGCISYGDFHLESLKNQDEWHSIGGLVFYNNSNGVVSECTNFGNFDLTEVNVNRSVYLGGIVGQNRGGTVSYCSNKGNITIDDISNVVRVGGIIGLIHQSYGGSIEYCTNSGNISITTSQQATAYENQIGGIVGDMPDGSGTVTRFTHLTNTGNISFSKSISSNATVETDNIGGICGRAGTTVTGTDLYNEGNITVSTFGRGAVGGILGWGGNTTINSSSDSEFKVGNKGNITVSGASRNETRSGVGGIVGIANKPVYWAYNEGSITVSGSQANYYPRVGGIVGSQDVWAQSISHCENRSGVTIRVNSLSKTEVGGIAGYLQGTTYSEGVNDVVLMDNCENKGSLIDVTSSAGACQVGGMIGYENYGTHRSGINRCPITVHSAGDVRVGGIRGGDNDGSARSTYCQNRGGISVYATGTATRVAGIAGQINGQINESNNTGAIYVESSAASNWIGGLGCRMGATKCSGINDANITFKYTGTGSPTINAGLCIAEDHVAGTIYYGIFNGTLSITLGSAVSPTVNCGAIIGLLSESGTVIMGNQSTSTLRICKDANIYGKGKPSSTSSDANYFHKLGYLIGRTTSTAGTPFTDRYIELVNSVN